MLKERPRFDAAVQALFYCALLGLCVWLLGARPQMRADALRGLPLAAVVIGVLLLAQATFDRVAQRMPSRRDRLWTYVGWPIFAACAFSWSLGALLESDGVPRTLGFTLALTATVVGLMAAAALLHRRRQARAENR
jgi:FtsH-binding integral membrane protein